MRLDHLNRELGEERERPERRAIGVTRTDPLPYSFGDRGSRSPISAACGQQVGVIDAWDRQEAGIELFHHSGSNSFASAISTYRADARPFRIQAVHLIHVVIEELERS